MKYVLSGAVPGALLLMAPVTRQRLRNMPSPWRPLGSFRGLPRLHLCCESPDNDNLPRQLPQPASNAVEYLISTVNMSISTAARSLSNVLNQSDGSVAANIPSRDAPANEADAKLIPTRSSNHNTPRKTRNTWNVRWQQTIEELVSRIPRRSTRGVAPKRLRECPEAESSTQMRVTRKRKPATQPPQPA
jgi:hypothetical protein